MMPPARLAWAAAPTLLTASVCTVLSWPMLGRGEHGGVTYTVLKCLPIVVLLVTSIFTLKSQGMWKHHVGIFFGLMGDLFLSFRSVQVEYFIAGTVAFAFSHIFYLATFHEQHKLDWKCFGFVALANVVISSQIFTPLQKEPVSLQAVIAPYALVLSFTLWSTLSQFVHQRRGHTSGITRAIGYLIFLLSDSMITFDTFVFVIPRSQAWIIITYYIAQVGIFLGAMLKEHEEGLGDKASKSLKKK